MAIDYAALKTEVTTDPKGLGYAGKSASDKAVLLNAATGAGAGPIARKLVPLDDPALASMLAYALPRIRAMANQADRDYYAALVQTINAVGLVYASDVNVQATITQAVTDGVITQALATAVGSRTGSRAEVLFGDGTTITWQDITKAGA